MRYSILEELLFKSIIIFIWLLLQEGNISLTVLLEKTHIMFLTSDGELKECTMEDLYSNDEKSELITTEAQREYIRYTCTSQEQLSKHEANSSEDEEELIVLLENNNNKKRQSWIVEKDFRLIGAVQTSDNGCTGLAVVGGLLVAISIHSQTQYCSNSSDSGDSSSGEEWVLIAPMNRGVYKLLILRVSLGNVYALLTKCEVTMARYWPSSLYSAILTEQARSIKDLLYGEKENFYLWDQCMKSRVGKNGPSCQLG